MDISLYTRSGIHESVATLHLELGPNVWWIAGRASAEWVHDGFPLEGKIVTGGLGSRTVRLFEQPSSQQNRAFLSLWNVPAHWSDDAAAGDGVFLDAAEKPYPSMRFYWIRNRPPTLSPARRALLNLISTKTNKIGINSKSQNWEPLTAITHEVIKESLRNDSNWTSCNSVAGGVAQRVTAKISPGRSTFLTAGVLDLSKGAEKTPGCWIEAAHGRFPRPGDYYSNQNIKRNQKFGHVGIVIGMNDGIIHTFDAGQDHREPNKPDESYGVALHKHRRYGAVPINGWIDLDAYFYGTPTPNRPVKPGR